MLPEQSLNRLARPVCLPCDAISWGQIGAHQRQHHQHQGQLQNQQQHQFQYLGRQYGPYEMEMCPMEDEQKQHALCSAWTSGFGDAVRYSDGMNYWVDTWVPGGNLDENAKYEPAQGGNGDVNGDANAMFTPFFLNDGGISPSPPLLDAQVNLMLPFSKQVEAGTRKSDLEPYDTLHGDDMLLDLDSNVATGMCNMAARDARVMRNGQSPPQYLVTQKPEEGIPDMSVTGSLPAEHPGMQRRLMHEKPGHKAGADAQSVPPRLSHVRKELAELETYLRAHVKDQLLQMRDVH
ncbi:hypothetical protein E4U21_006542 [Claviceps maximensis]|nr:hypothetical protein E4U21_006542 [Claviceps maximensis]